MRIQQQTLKRVLPLVFAVCLVSTPGVAEELNFSDSELSLLKTFATWPPSVPADPGNEYSGEAWAEELGAVLFNDTALSGNQSISCATCHQSEHGLAETTAVSVAGAQPHVRNTQGLLNVGYQRWFGWDGGADSLWAASLRPMLSEVEMASNIEDLANTLRRSNTLNQSLSEAGIDIKHLNDEALVVAVGKFIGAYLRTLTSHETRFDQFVADLINGENNPAAEQFMSISAQRGMKLFFGEGNCFVCHFGPNFSNGEFHDIGRPFFTAVGQVDPGRLAGIKRLKKDPYNLDGYFNGTKEPSDILKTTSVKTGQITFGQWRTPSLRNLLSTAPYMHDGSLATLREVVDYYADIDPSRLHSKGEAILKPNNWTSSERNDLVEFLKALSE